ncbi:TolC family protein [Haliovirga abyssi]|uniref:TolC family protein n=1 Tax=Haliovirga abyssi TaxID=2996794 RepID=A0AAU9DB91_9FUSO|nr:TolC family protein [Haliovirga abyssi]BDU49457.1 hypothetical protein HLVA_00260 [Haliovirga abyssi]
MKQNFIKVIILMILFQTNLFAVEKINLEGVIKSFIEKSSYREKEKIEIKKLDIEKQGNVAEEWRKISFNINPIYNSYKNKDTNKYFGNTTLNFGYKMFYLNFNYDNSTDKLKRTIYKIGLSESLDDVIYSEQKYKKKLLKLKEKVTMNRLSSEKITEIKSIIELYADIKNIESEIDIKRKTLKNRNKEFENLKEKYKQNEAVKIDVDYMSIKIKEIKNNIVYLEESFENNSKKLLEKVGIKSRKKIVFEDISDVNIDKIGVNELEITSKGLEINSKEEEIKYSVIRSCPEVKLDVNYDIENKIWMAGVVFTGNVLESKTDIKTEKEELKKLKIEKKEIEAKRNRTEQQLEIEYQNLLNKKKILKDKRDNFGKRYLISKSVYKKGYMSLINYIKSQEDYEKAEMEYKKAKNELNAFKYKIKFGKKTFYI